MLSWWSPGVVAVTCCSVAGSPIVRSLVLVFGILFVVVVLVAVLVVGGNMA